MIILLLGSCLLILGVLSIRFPDISKALSNYDSVQWHRLGSPAGYSFSDLGNTLSLYSWLLNEGYNTCESQEVKSLCIEAHKKAVMAKYLMQVGVLLLVVGSGLALAGY